MEDTLTSQHRPLWGEAKGFQYFAFLMAFSPSFLSLSLWFSFDIPDPVFRDFNCILRQGLKQKDLRFSLENISSGFV